MIFFIALVHLSAPCSAHPSGAPTHDSTARQILETAVYEYLQLIAPGKAQLEQVMQQPSLFVAKCQLCTGSKAAFQRYYRLAGSVATTHYPDLFGSSGKEAQFQQLQSLVAAAVKYYLSKHPLTAAERTAIQQKLEAERLRSMNRLKIKQCASCDGACTANEP